MTKEELVNAYPWIALRGVFHFVDKFTADEWKLMNDYGFAQVLQNSDSTNDRVSLLHSLDYLRNNRIYREKNIGFIGLIEELIRQYNNRYFRSDDEQSSYPEIKRLFPAWLSSNPRLRKLANQFSDVHIWIMDMLVDPQIRSQSDLIGIVLNLIVNHLQKDDLISTINIIDFAELFKRCQSILLSNIKEAMPEIQQTITDLIKTKSDVFEPGQLIRDCNRLIRLFIKEYNNIHIPIPTEGPLRNRLLECALRNAAFRGSFEGVITLINFVENINAPSPSNGRTALHYAVLFANKAGDRKCFDILWGLDRVNRFIEDKEEKTAIELWDFEAWPDDSLKIHFDLIQVSLEEPDPSFSFAC